jgi:hypothetical protein
MLTSIKLFELLKEINSLKTTQFSGLGLILYKGDVNLLPISPLKKTNHSVHLPIESYNLIIEFLLSISEINNKYHDGFHLLNENFKLTHISQYVAPPIIKNIVFESGSGGSRFRTAIYSSFLDNVIGSGVLSKNYGPKVFVKGHII